MVKNEQNVWIHIAAAIFVIIIGFWFRLTRAEWILIVSVIGLVFLAEGLNTSIEQLSNAVTSEKNEKIKNAKDISAGAVLIAAVVAVITGLLIFIPHICK